MKKVLGFSILIALTLGKVSAAITEYDGFYLQNTGGTAVHYGIHYIGGNPLIDCCYGGPGPRLISYGSLSAGSLQFFATCLTSTNTSPGTFKVYFYPTASGVNGTTGANPGSSASITTSPKSYANGWPTYYVSSANLTNNAQTYTLTQSVTNNAVTSETFRLNVNGTNIVKTLLPGEVATFNYVATNAISGAKIEKYIVYQGAGVDAQGNPIAIEGTWQTVIGPINRNIADTVYNNSAGSGGVVGGTANVFSPGLVSSQLGALPTLPDATPNTSTGNAELNADARANAQRNLTLAIGTNQLAAQSAQIAATLAVKDSIDRLNANNGAAGLSNALAANYGKMTNDLFAGLTNGTGPGLTPGPPISMTNNWSAYQSPILEMLPSYSVPVASAPSFTLPIATLGVGIADQTISFDSPVMSDVASFVRGLLLVIFNVYFFYKSIDLVGRTLGSVSHGNN